MAGEGVERGLLSELYMAHAPDGIRIAFLLTGDRALAEDLVQEAFARLVGRLRHLREPNAFGGLPSRDLAEQQAILDSIQIKPGGPA